MKLLKIALIGTTVIFGANMAQAAEVKSEQTNVQGPSADYISSGCSKWRCGYNGFRLNGLGFNGIFLQGLSFNGISFNGIGWNGLTGDTAEPTNPFNGLTQSAIAK